MYGWVEDRDREEISGTSRTLIHVTCVRTCLKQPLSSRAEGCAEPPTSGWAADSRARSLLVLALPARIVVIIAVISLKLIQCSILASWMITWKGSQ